MLRRSRFSRALIAAFLVLASAGAAFAQGQVLDGPRRAGTIGERYDGYAVVRSQSESVTLAPLVGSVNAERRKIYTERAHAENVPVEQIGRVYAAEIYRSAPSGTWFLRDDGQWIRK